MDAQSNRPLNLRRIRRQLILCDLLILLDPGPCKSCELLLLGMLYLSSTLTCYVVDEQREKVLLNYYKIQVIDL